MATPELSQILNHFNSTINAQEFDTEYALKQLKKGEQVSKWRQVYTDGMIVKALLRNDIRCLDEAIIVAGAQNRQELVHQLVEKIQATLSDTHAVLPRLFTSKESPATLYTFTPFVPHLHSTPSLSTFRSTIQNHPFVLPAYAACWPAVHKWTDLNYLHAVAGPSRTVPVEIGHDYRTNDWSQRVLPWDEFLLYLSQPEENQSERWYMAQHDLFMQFPALRGDIEVPDYVYAVPEGMSEEYKGPPANEDGYILNTWVGPSRTVSPAHTDPYYNFYVQLVGRKSIWLAPPFSAIPKLPEMKNTASIDVFEDDVTVPGAMWVTLEPGDACCFAPGWWHAMRSEDTSISLSIWF